jgi:hypothetical protein
MMWTTNRRNHIWCWIFEESVLPASHVAKQVQDPQRRTQRKASKGSVGDKTLFSIHIYCVNALIAVPHHDLSICVVC